MPKKFQPILLAQLCALLVSTHCASAADSFQKELDEARKLMDAQQLGQALTHCDKAIALKPQSATGYVLRSECHRRLSHNAPAIADANKAIALEPKNGEGYYERANTLLWQHKQNDARKDLKLAASLGCKPAKDLATLLGDPTSEAEDLRYQGTRNRGDNEELALLTKSIQLDPNNKSAYNDRAGYFWRKREYDKAVADYTKAISLAPKWASLLIYRGMVYEEAGKVVLADRDFVRALAMPPEDETLLLRSKVELKKGKYNDALKDANKAIWMDSTTFEAYLVTGSACAKLGQYEKAIAEYTKGIKCSEPYAHPDFLKLRAESYDKLKRPQDAAKDRALADKIKRGH